MVPLVKAARAAKISAGVAAVAQRRPVSACRTAVRHAGFTALSGLLARASVGAVLKAMMFWPASTV